MAMKELLKGIFRTVGYDIVQNVDMPINPFDVLRYVIADQLVKDSNFYFVQIGANDGVTSDPLREHILRHKIAGLLVEPLPDLFERLRSNYAGCPRLAFERCAIARQDGEAQLYRVRSDAPLPEWGQGLASFQRSHLSGKMFGIKDLEDYVEEVTVPCLTVNSLLERYHVQNLTLLQIDVEGFDCEIVRMAIESGLRPPIINYEFIHASPSDRVECKHMLAAAGYRFIDVGRDTLALRLSKEV